MKVEYKQGVIYITQEQLSRILDDINHGTSQDFTSLSWESERGDIFLDGLRVVVTKDKEERK